MQEVFKWFRALNPTERKRLILVAAALAAVLAWLLSQQTQSVEISSDSEPAAIEISGVIYVHVVGEVQAPGMYELDLGSRVQDAISMAGGFTPEASHHSVNLARTLSDGEQVVVLGQDAEQFDSGLISINRATLEQLQELPGVGPALAQRIVDQRKQSGAFSDIRDLREVAGIGEKLFAKIKDQITL